MPIIGLINHDRIYQGERTKLDSSSPFKLGQISTKIGKKGERLHFGLVIEPYLGNILKIPCNHSCAFLRYKEGNIHETESVIPCFLNVI